MKLNDRITITCSSAFKERFDKALNFEARTSAQVPNQAEKGRELIEAYCDSVLLPANHPRNVANRAG